MFLLWLQDEKRELRSKNESRIFQEHNWSYLIEGESCQKSKTFTNCLFYISKARQKIAGKEFEAEFFKSVIVL